MKVFSVTFEVSAPEYTKARDVADHLLGSLEGDPEFMTSYVSGARSMSKNRFSVSYKILVDGYDDALVVANEVLKTFQFAEEYVDEEERITTLGIICAYEYKGGFDERFKF